MLPRLIPFLSRSVPNASKEKLRPPHPKTVFSFSGSHVYAMMLAMIFLNIRVTIALIHEPFINGVNIGI